MPTENFKMKYKKEEYFRPVINFKDFLVSGRK